MVDATYLACERNGRASGELPCRFAGPRLAARSAAGRGTHFAAPGAEGTTLAGPIQIIHIATRTSASAFTRSYLDLGKDVRAVLVESFAAAENASAYQANHAVVLRIGDGAELSHVRLMADATDATNIASEICTIGAKAKLNLFNLTSGGLVSRFQGFITLQGEGSDLSINGVNLLNGKQHADTTLLVENADTVFTRRCSPGQQLLLPIKHGEGAWYADHGTYVQLSARGQIVLRYAEDVNGAFANVAGVVNAAGNVLGLMPHPEHAVYPLLGSADGGLLLAALADAAAEHVLAVA